ncbi:MAG: alpha/beta hydrolase, partial [Bacilli bacterium]|nr:alpha/beta hydrolase [Bacilli bacterium]
KESTEEIYPDITAKLFHIAPTTFLEFIKLVKTYKNCTKKVVCNTLIIYGEKDELVPYKSIKYALDTIPSKRKYLTKVGNVRHRILISKRKEEVSEYIRIFLRGGLKWNKTKKSNM